MEDKREINAMWLNGSLGSVEEACDRIKQLHEWDQQTIAGLKNRIKDLEDIHYKDHLVQEMQQKMEEMEHNYYQGFPINDQEQKAISAWQKQHIETFHNNKAIIGVSGGNWVYEYIPTSLGTIGKCRCNSCYRKAQQAAIDSNESWLDDRIASKWLEFYDAEFTFSEPW